MDRPGRDYWWMTDWEQCYLGKNTPWDYGAPSPCLEYHLDTAARNEFPVSGRVLIPGCGLAHDAIPLVKSGAQVTALDISSTAIEQARKTNSMEGLEFVLGDLFDLPAGLRQTFDWIWEHTCFCAIDPDLRPGYVDSVAGALKPGGQLLGVFFLDPWDEDEVYEPPPFGTDLEELRTLFEKRFTISRFWDPGRCYPGREGKEKMAHMILRNQV